MAKSNNLKSPKNPKSQKKDLDLSQLNPIVARRVLQDLLEQQPELKPVAAALVNAAIKSPRMEDLAEEIETALNQISEGDVYINSGRTWRGYREPDEGAAEVLSEVMEPYFERLEELCREQDEQNALNLCEAIILALYRLKHGDNFSEIEEYAEDYPEETADCAAQLWRSGGNLERSTDKRFSKDRTIPAEFVRQFVPEWDWLLPED